MNKTDKRNLYGSLCCFILSVLFGGFGIAYMMLREVYQAQNYNIEIEKDDIVRYSFIGALGYAVQISIFMYLYTRVHYYI